MKRVLSMLFVLLFVFTGCSSMEQAMEPVWEVSYEVGSRYLSEGKYEEAILAFEAAIEIDPKASEAYLGLAEAYEATEQTWDAILAYKRAIKVDAACQEAYVRLVTIYVFRGEYADAYALLQDALAVLGQSEDLTKLLADIWQAQYDLAEQYFREGNYEAAVRAYETAIEIDPMRMEAYLGQAAAYEALGDKKAALLVIETAITQLGERPELLEAKPVMEPPVKDLCRYVIFTDNSIQQYWENGKMVDGPKITSCCYHIPQLNLGSGVGDAVSEQIYQELDQKYEARIADCMMWNCPINYEWYQNDDIISIVTCVTSNSPVMQYSIYNVSAETGELLTTDEILEYCGIAKTDYLARTQAIMAQCLDEQVWQYVGKTPDATTAEAEIMQDETFSQENLSKVVPYLGPDGELYFSAYIPGFSQLGNRYLFQFESGEKYRIQPCQQEHSEEEAAYIEN